MQSSSQADLIAQACLTAYNKLPPKGKPRTRKDGVREWTVLAGLVLLDSETDHVEVVSLGTGIKCLSADKLPLYGDVLHDSHAEIIARRGFLLWLYVQLSKALQGQDDHEAYLERLKSSTNLFRLKPRYKLALYVSTLPCGDASMKLLAMTQDPDVAALFTEDQALASIDLSRGRQGFNVTSALRTKPARADAICTSSLSCSDKLASWTILGIQGALLSIFVEPIYVETYVFGGVQDAYQVEIREECTRALVGRLCGIQELVHPYHLSKPCILFTTLSFQHEKMKSAEGQAVTQAGCHESLSWVVGHGTEVTSQGIKQGNSLKPGIPQMSRARSRVCRMNLFRLWQDTLALAGGLESVISQEITYRQAKQGAEGIQQAKSALRGKAKAPFASWVVNDSKHQAFTLGQAGA